MKKAILAFFAVLSLNAFAQKEPLVTPYAVPVDSITGLITYEGVIEAKTVSAGELYHRMSEWFNSYYKNPTEVIRENDSVKHAMVGKPRFRLSNPPGKDGLKTDGGTIQYTISVTAREGRFRYELSAFNWKQISYYPCERWMDTQAQSYAPVFNDYLQQLDKTALEVISSLKSALTMEKPVKDRDNW